MTHSPTSRLTSSAVFLVLLALALLFQVHSGAWKSDFGAHADEGAHVVTSLMMRDYIAGGFLNEVHPLKYAEQYYEKYPKVVIGHYPPVFYIANSVLLLIYRQPASLLITLCLMTATLGWLTWRLGAKALENWKLALAVAFTVTLLPMVRTYTAIVMADVLLTIFCIAAAGAFARFLENSRWQYSTAFGILAALAILTKGSGLLLAVLPPVAILLTGQWNQLKRWQLWIAVVPVLLFAFPWLLLTRHITAEGMSNLSMGEYLFKAVPFYFGAGAGVFGWGLWLAFVGAMLALLVRIVKRRPTKPEIAVLWGLVGGLFLLYALVPSGFDARYLMPVIPAVFILTYGALKFLIHQKSPQLAFVVIIALCGLTLMETARHVEKTYTGATEAISLAIEEIPDPDPKKLLVVSNAGGEGALVAAGAFINDDSVSMERGTKFLASTDWLGRGYESGFETPQDLANLLAGEGIGAVIFDAPIDNASALPHWNKIAEFYLSEGDENLKIKVIPSKRKFDRENRFYVVPITSGASTEIAPRSLDAETVVPTP